MKRINELLPETIRRTAINPRFYRLLGKLSKSKGTTSKQVAEITGASNPYSEIEKLRKLGWIIINIPSVGVDQDGKRRHFVRYSLANNQLPDAFKVIEYFNSEA